MMIQIDDYAWLGGMKPRFFFRPIKIKCVHAYTHTILQDILCICGTDDDIVSDDVRRMAIARMNTIWELS